MTWWQVISAIGAVVASFAAGWLIANEKLRVEVFKRRLEAYLEINRLAGEVLVANIVAELDPETLPDVAQARVTLSNYVMRHTLLLSLPVINQVTAVTPGTNKADSKAIRLAFNELLSRMARDLRLSEIQAINTALVSPVDLDAILRKSEERRTAR